MTIVKGLVWIAAGLMTFTNEQAFAKATAPVNNEVCFSPHENCDQKLLAFIATAKSTIDIAIYNITLRDMLTELDAARDRGVKIRIVCDRREGERKTSLVDDIRRAGFNIRFGNVDGLMHNKFTIVDRDMVQTGSFNYTLAASNRSAENQIYLTNEKVVSRFQKEFDELWSEGTPVPAGFVGTKEYEKE